MEPNKFSQEFTFDEGVAEKSIDFRKIINKAISLWPWMILCSVCTVLIALTYLYFANPLYKINAKILIKSEDNKTSNMTDISMLQNIGLMTGASSVDNELEIIKSYTLMHEVVKSLQLNVMVTSEQKLKTVEQYGPANPFKINFIDFNQTILNKAPIKYDVSVADNKLEIVGKESEEKYKCKFGDTLNTLAGKFIIEQNPEFAEQKNGHYAITVSDQEAVTGGLMNRLDANIPNKQVSTIDLTLTNSVPLKGEKIVNTLIDAYMQANVDDNNRIADSTMNFIDTRLLVVGDQLTDIEKRIQTFKQDNEVADLTAQSQMLISNTGDYAKKVADQQVQLNVIESLEKYLTDNVDNPRVVPATLTGQDPALTAVVDQYNTLLMQRSRMLLGTTVNNPMIKNIDEQLVNLRSDILKGMANIKRSAKVALEALQKNSGQLEAQIRQVPAKERVYLDFSRQQQIRQELYLFLLQKREETAISRSSTIANARIIDAAKADDGPFEPKKKIIVGISLLLGILLPFAIVFIKDSLNSKIKTKEDIESHTNIPIVGEIGHNDEDAFVIVSRTSRSLVAEQFRALRANLQFLFTDKNDKVIMLTSSMSGEGKSFIATNLAMVFALADKKVVLLELDLRKPKIMASLGLKFDKGFSQYAIGAVTLDDIIYPSGVHDNLYIIPAGPIPPNPSELILHERTAAMFKELKEKFDYIVVDTTPNLVSDAQLLSIHANATLYVARLDYTHKDQLNIPDKLQKQGKLPKLNLIINDIKPKRYGGGYYGYGYGGYGYGGYGNSYGYGEYLEHPRSKKKSRKSDKA